MNAENPSPHPNTAEAAYAAEPSSIEGAPDTLQISQLDEMVDLYQEMLGNPQFQKEDGGPDHEKIDAAIKQTITTRLEGAGLSADPEGNTQEYDFAYSVIERAIRSSQQEWRGAPNDEGTEQVGVRNEVFREMRAHYGSGETVGDNNGVGNEPEDAPASLVDEFRRAANAEVSEAEYDAALAMNAEFDDLNRRLDAARDTWAQMSSKHLGRAFSRSSAEYEQAKQDYENLVRERGRWALDNNVLASEDERLTPGEKNARVIGYLFEEQAVLREQTVAELEKTKVSRFVQWMNKGNIAQRAAKGIGLGLAAGAAGALVAGAAGAGLLAAGAVGASRFVKGYAARDRHRGSNIRQELGERDEEALRQGLMDGQVLDVTQSHGRTNNLLERDVHAEQKERKRALGWGAVSVALGAGLSYGISEAAGNTDRVRTWVGDKFDSLKFWGNDAPSGEKSETSAGAESTEPSTEKQDGTSGESHDSGQDGPSPEIEVLAAELGQPFNVEAGHGLTHELMEISKAHGVTLTPEEAWRLHTELVDLHGEYVTRGDGGVATYDMGDSKYEMGLAAQGEYSLTPEARDFLTEYIAAEGGSAADAGEFAAEPVAESEAPAAETVAEDSGVEAETPAEATPSESTVEAPVEQPTPEAGGVSDDVRYWALEQFQNGTMSAFSVDTLPAELQVNALAASLDGLSYSDGSPIVEYSSLENRFVFLDRPDGATMTSEAVNTIHNHFRDIGQGALADEIVRQLSSS